MILLLWCCENDHDIYDEKCDVIRMTMVIVTIFMIIHMIIIIIIMMIMMIMMMMMMIDLP